VANGGGSEQKPPPLNGWSRSEIVEQANRWASRTGADQVGDQTLLDWKKDGLLPRVGARSLGRGKGTEGLWGAPAYRQLLRVMQLRRSGVLRRRDLRLRLWVEGYPVPWRRVRSDFEALLGPAITRSNRELGTVRWPKASGQDPPPLASRSIGRHWLAPASVRRSLTEAGLPAFLAEEVTEWLQRTEVRDVLTRYAYLLFSQDPRGLRAALERATEGIPESFRTALVPDEGLLGMFAGFFAPPSKGENRAWTAVRRGDERLFTNLRDLTTNVDALWSSTLRLGALAVRGGYVDVPTWLKPLLTGGMESLSRARPMQNSERRVVLATLLLNRRQNLEDHAEPLGILGRAMPSLLNWLVDHPEILDVARRDPVQAQRLASAACLSPETMALLRGELTPPPSVAPTAGSEFAATVQPDV